MPTLTQRNLLRELPSGNPLPGNQKPPLWEPKTLVQEEKKTQEIKTSFWELETPNPLCNCRNIVNGIIVEFYLEEKPRRNSINTLDPFAFLRSILAVADHDCTGLNE